MFEFLGFGRRGGQTSEPETEGAPARPAAQPSRGADPFAEEVRGLAGNTRGAVMARRAALTVDKAALTTIATEHRSKKALAAATGAPIGGGRRV